MVVSLSSVSVMVALLTFSPATVVVPGMVMLSLPSTMLSSVGVMVSVPLPLAFPASMVILASVVAA